MLNGLDRELERRGHKFVRYADGCMILCKSRKSAKRTLENILVAPYVEHVEVKPHCFVAAEREEPIAKEAFDRLISFLQQKTEKR